MHNLTRLLPLLLLAPLHGALAYAAPAVAKDLGAIWFIGDSITQSNADGDPQGSPRKSLHDLLTASGYTFTYTGHHTANVDGLPESGDKPESDLYRFHSGISGSVIGDGVGGRAGMTKSLPQFWAKGRLASVKPSIVLVMLGTNDVNSDVDPDHAPARLKKFVEALYALPGARRPAVFISTIAPNRTQETMPAKTAAYNAALPKVVAALRASGKDVTLVDAFTPLNAGYEKLMRDDNLHPNGDGNAAIARVWFAALEARAKKSR